MAFKICGSGDYDRAQALRDVHDATQYLRQSNLAGDILDDLEQSTKIITLEVGPGLNDRYEHPPLPSDSPFVGTVYWDPGFTLQVIDKAKRRPEQKWVPQKKEKRTIWNCCGRRAPIDHYGQINPNVCLMHELGHVLQYLSNPAEFTAHYRNADGTKRVDSEIVTGKNTLEQTNTAAIEQPVILELRAAGCNLGIRWDYYDSGN